MKLRILGNRALETASDEAIFAEDKDCFVAKTCVNPFEYLLEIQAGCYKPLPFTHALRIVQSKELHCHWSFRRKGWDYCTALLAGIFPLLRAWIEEGNKCTGQRIGGLDIRALGSITSEARKGQVVFMGLPIVLPWDDVIWFIR